MSRGDRVRRKRRRRISTRGLRLEQEEDMNVSRMFGKEVQEVERKAGRMEMVRKQ